EQGQYAEARCYVERALEIQERVLGADHPDTAQSLQTLGAVLVEQEEYAEARRTLERALEIQERVLGADHPDTARCQIGLGLVLQTQGTASEAHSYFARAVAILERRLGPYHPQTQAARVILTAGVLSDPPLILKHESLAYTDLFDHRSDTQPAQDERAIRADAGITVLEDRAR
ncbi:MAG TPA: tetratricopeptide repeat-containing protein, partial [Herpetosiphonaceae bacterium]